MQFDKWIVVSICFSRFPTNHSSCYYLFCIPIFYSLVLPPCYPFTISSRKILIVCDLNASGTQAYPDDGDHMLKAVEWELNFFWLARPKVAPFQYCWRHWPYVTQANLTALLVIPCSQVWTQSFRPGIIRQLFFHWYCFPQSFMGFWGP